jgi:hypothetical protein
MFVCNPEHVVDSVFFSVGEKSERQSVAVYIIYRFINDIAIVETIGRVFPSIEAASSKDSIAVSVFAWY